MFDQATATMLEGEGAAAPESLAPPIQSSPVTDERELFDAYSEAVSSVVDIIGPAVVRVDTRTKERKSGGQPGEGGRSGGTGSGVVISPDGLVLTNAHVVNGAREIRLSDTEGRTTEARLLGIDPDTDLALLRGDAARSLPFAPLGDSKHCLLYTSPSPRDRTRSRMPSSA